jgi:hypothetical protein
MTKCLFSSLNEWRRLESLCASSTEAEQLTLEALSAVVMEILAMEPGTKAEAFVQLRFCATFLERNGGKGSLAAGAIRSSANLLGWMETHPSNWMDSATQKNERGAAPLIAVLPDATR